MTNNKISIEPLTVSACLLGHCTRYDGGSSASAEVAELVKGRTTIPVCPEELGGLPTPRPKAWLRGGGGGDVIEGRARVIDENGKDVTNAFINGAKETLKIMRQNASTTAYLKEKSPSCGVTITTIDGQPTTNNGVTAALLIMNGITVRGFF